jgi:transcriptional antiterminator RfaH
MKADSKRENILNKSTQEKSKWFVFYTKPRAEIKANDELIEAGYHTYLPLQKVLKNYSDRKKWIDKPVLSSYIFVKIKKHQIYELLNLNYITRYVKYQGEPAVVREDQLLTLKRVLLNKSEVEVQSGQLEVGKEITMKTGPFKDLKGNILEIRGKKKFVIQFKSLNSNIIVSLDDLIIPKQDSV